jgi:excisionase family DNA binding protein
MSRPDDLRLYTVGDVEQRLQLSRAKVYDLIRTRQLRSITIGRSRRIPHQALTDYIHTRTLEGL